MAWLVWVAAFVVMEWLAYVRGGYWATATGHLVAAMLAHAWLFVVIPLLFVGLAAHLWIDALVLRLK